MSVIQIPRRATPSIQAGYARSASESAFPGLRDGLEAAWSPMMGARKASLTGKTGPLNSTSAWNWISGREGEGIKHDSQNLYVGTESGADILPRLDKWSVCYVVRRRAVTKLYNAFQLNCTNIPFSLGTHSSSTTWNVKIDNGVVVRQLLFSGINATDVIYGVLTFDSSGTNRVETYLRDSDQGIRQTGSTLSSTPASLAGYTGLNCASSTETHDLLTLQTWSRVLSQDEIYTLLGNPLAPFRLKSRVFSFPAAVTPTTTKIFAVPRRAEPSLGAGYARSASEAAFPGLRRGLWSAWSPELGNSGDTLRNISNSNGDADLALGAPAGWVVGDGGTVLRTSAASYIISTNIAKTGTGPLTIISKFKTTDASGSNTNYLISWGTALIGNYTSVTCESGVIWARCWFNTAYAGSGYNDGEWHSCALVKPESATVSEMQIYVDGTSLATTTSGSTTIDLGDTNKIHLACDAASPGDSGPAYIGDLGTCLIYSRILSPNEIQHLYQDPLAPFRLKSRIFSFPAAAGEGGGLDTAEQRMSAVGVGMPWRGPGQTPSGEVDRTAAAGYYSAPDTVPDALYRASRLQTQIPGVHIF